MRTFRWLQLRKNGRFKWEQIYELFWVELVKWSVLRKAWFEGVKSKRERLDDFLCFVILLFAGLQLLRKERLKDVECKGEGLDGRRAGTHYHTPGQRASLDREIVNNSRGHHMMILICSKILQLTRSRVG